MHFQEITEHYFTEGRSNKHIILSRHSRMKEYQKNKNKKRSNEWLKIPGMGFTLNITGVLRFN